MAVSFIRFLVPLLLLSSSGSLVFGQRINVALIELSGALDAPDSGWAAALNREVLERVEKQSSYRFDVKSYPGRRAIQMFRDMSMTLLYPTV